MLLPLVVHAKMIAESNMRLSFHFRSAFLLFLVLAHYTASQKTCPNCGSMQVPYPLSTEPSCGDPYYKLRCDLHAQRLYFDTLNGSSYLVLKIMSSIQRMVLQPPPWLQGSCVTQDMPRSNGIWLNQSLPFNITSSNTVFLFNCSPRLLVSPLNCTSSSICHRYLENSGHVDTKRALECASGGGLHPCCTFLAGGIPSAYRIRLHNSGCKAFRSILHLDQEKPPNQWEEGLEIQWAPPPEPVCRTQRDCSRDSKCSPAGRNGLFRCLCNGGHHWDPFVATCVRYKRKSKWKTSLVVSIGVIAFFSLAVVLAIITKSFKLSSLREKQAKEREDKLKSSAGEKPYRMFQLKEVKKATNGFSKDRILGSGGFGEVYKGELQDGTLVAVKKARVGNLKSTQQVLNEVAILSQVNHKNLVRLLGCCVESDQPLMIYEYISNGTLYDHLHGRYSNFLDWKTRLKVAFQTAEALAYLHSAAHTPIYHRDVKSTNILLDDEFNAKVSDFGLSRLASPGLSHVSTCAQGTLGYLDPEYYRNYQLTDKSDVYSYGVVLLELLTSQKAIDFNRDQDDVNLAIHVTQHASNGTIVEVVDQRLVSLEPSGDKMNTSIKLFLELALDCLKEKKGERPSMRDIVQRLLCIIRIVEQE
ncbi:wall-associated receptor kinase-like 20 [Abrus precatorius]|uniref:Wall-associated receptor kinase-like 20 n=1 Tax=Abrus precatorius TaxID=3816 RepID=A0A8B8LCU7_ABRPR|nr:wall-associated receptor kinase-like 20 [Abrus precatorius]